MALTNYDLTGLTQWMPLSAFFNKMSSARNASLFVQERDSGKINEGRERRSVITSLVSIIDMIYPGTKCRSDLDRIATLLQSPQLVTKENFVGVYEDLQTFITTVLFGPLDFNSQSTRMSHYKHLIMTHEWFSLADLVRLDFFCLSPTGSAARNRTQTERVEHNLENNIQIHQWDVLKIIRRLKAMVDETDKDSIDWFNAAVSLLQASTGSRFIEAASVSTFEPSDEPEVYDKYKYIKVTGIAKDNVLGSYKKQLREALESNDIEKQAELEDMTLDDVKASVDDVVILRPMIFLHLGITPQFLCDMSIKVKTYVQKVCGPAADNKAINLALCAGANRFFDTLWSPAMLASFGRSKSHIWRKIYANYSFKMYNPSGNINVWIMKMLGHTSLISSHHYANVNVVMGAKTDVVDSKTVIAAMQEDIDRLKEEHEELKETCRLITEAITPPPRVNDDISELEDESTQRIHLVALPKTGGGFVYIKPFDRKVFFRRFRDQQEDEKAAWTTARHNQIKAAFGDNVVMSRMTYDLWRQLNVPRDMGRELSSE